MRRRTTAGLSAALVVAGLSVAVPASAATGNLYVNNGVAANCSDAGSGSQTQPYCTIMAAAAVAQPGQTVVIIGTHEEQVVLSHSGTPGAPITFQGTGQAAVEYAGLTITGQHDLVVTGLNFILGSGVSISNSSAITFHGNEVSGNSGTGIDLDAATHDVQVRSNVVTFNAAGSGDGIRVAGTGSIVVDNTVDSNGEPANGNAAGIDILSSAVNTVVADNTAWDNRRDAILVAGTGTDVVNNTVQLNCADGIDVADGANGTVVENNSSYADGRDETGPCPSTPPQPVELGVYGTATSTTRVDYNLTHPGGYAPYAWGTPQLNLAAFQAASGQGAHDIVADPLAGGANTPSYLSPAIDSADSGAPGVQSTDIDGNAPVDEPYSPTTGVGPVAYLDRGAVELVSGRPPSPAPVGTSITAQTPMPNPSWKVTLSANTAVGWAPVSYAFDFGDGSPRVTQSTSTASHVYTKPGTYLYVVIKTDAAGNGDSVIGQVDLTEPKAVLAVTQSPSDPFTVTADASGSTRGTLRYTFGDGTTLDKAASTVTHTYAHPGTYIVTLTVTDGLGLTVSASQTVVLVGAYTPLGPVRVLDTRAAIGVPGTTAVQPGQTVSLNLAGVAGVPASGVTAVALNVTVTEPSSSGVLTVYPDGQPRPTASNLNYVAGQTVPNMVIVQVVDGRVAFFNNSAGTVHIVADLAGYFSHDPTASSYTPLNPARVLDTRAAIGVPTTTAAQPGQTVTLQVAGAGGVPASGVTAVVLNVTVTEPSSPGVLTVYPDGQPRPTASNLNYVAGQTVPNLVIVPVVNGTVDFFNNSPGTVHVVADVAGYFSHDPTAGTYTPVSPLRVLDTRAAIGVSTTTALAPGQALTLPVAGLPASGVTAVVLNVTVTAPTSSGVLTVYPDDPRPSASNLNWVAGQTVPNLVVVPVVNGTVKFFNNSPGTVHVVADLAGFFTQ